MTERIRGKVARILDTRNLVINIGETQGVSVGMHFDVLDPKGEDIVDPDTHDVLGSIERPKVRVVVTRTEKRLAIASTFRKKDVNVGGRGPSIHSGLADMFLPPKIVTKYETLKTTETTWEDLKEADSYVKTGDPVVQVVEEIDVGSDESLPTGANAP